MTVLWHWIDDDDRRWAIPPGMTPLNTAGCRGCGQLVLWIVTAAGQRMPLNIVGTKHFETCPKSIRGDQPPMFAGIETVEPR